MMAVKQLRLAIMLRGISFKKLLSDVRVTRCNYKAYKPLKRMKFLKPLSR